MAYNHTVYEVELRDADHSFDATGTGAIATWHPGYMPHIIRAVSVTLLSSAAVTTAPVYSLRKVDPVGSTSAPGDQFDTLSLTTAMTQGQSAFVDQLDQEILPGEGFEINQTTAGNAGLAVGITLLVEPRWEHPGNNTDLIESA